MLRFHAEEHLKPHQLQMRSDAFAAFSELPIPMEKLAFFTTNLREDELEYLRGKSWHEVYSNREIAVSTYDMPWLQDSGFLYYLPAFLLSSLEVGEDENFAEELESHIMRRASAMESFVGRQREIICGFFTEMCLCHGLWEDWQFRKFCENYCGFSTSSLYIYQANRFPQENN